MTPIQELPDAAALRELRERLEETRRELIAEYRDDYDRERAIPVDETGDVADRAETAWEREELFAEVAGDRDRLREVEDALRRMDEGSYGRCATGGEPIPLERLRAVPWARRCAAHQAALEAGGAAAAEE
jgi:RNA polymerase-binding transcription factor DksA